MTRHLQVVRDDDEEERALADEFGWPVELLRAMLALELAAR